MGVFDLPAVIDYILKDTGHQKLKYVGHSMGITMFLILLSEHPEYNEKISAAAALAPVAYITHAPTPLRDFLVTRGTESLMVSNTVTILVIDVFLLLTKNGSEPLLMHL